MRIAARSGSSRRVIGAVLARISSIGGEQHVDIGVTATGIHTLATAHCDEHAISITLVDKVMTVGASLWPDGNVACAHRRPSVILDQHRFPRQHDNHFVLAVMPMPL